MNCPPQSPDLNSADYLWGQLKTRIYDIIRILMRSLSEIWTQKDISLYLVWLNVSVFSHRWQYRLAQLYGHHFFPVALACLGIKDRNWSRWSVGRSFLLQYLDNKKFWLQGERGFSLDINVWMGLILYFLLFCFYKYHQGKLGDIKAPRHLIIERCMAGGRCEGDADSWLLLLRNNDAPEQTVGPGHGRRVCAEAGILRKTSEAQWQEHSARENPV